jgi:hypothetical protein
MFGMRRKPCDRNTPVGNGGQGRNRTIDTRIFSSSESLVRRGKAEEAERVFSAPTEPPSPTEHIPNPGGRSRPSRAVSSRDARAAVHRDRARTESGNLTRLWRGGETGNPANLATSRTLVHAAGPRTLSTTNGSPFRSAAKRTRAGVRDTETSATESGWAPSVQEPGP